MIKIRKNVFETNSSSSHSLVYEVNSRTGDINKPDIDYDIHLYDFAGDDPKKGILAIHFGEYGWGSDPCDSFRSKLSYLMTQNIPGHGMEYYGNVYDKKEIRIETQEQWDEVIEKYVLTDPKIIKILDLIKEKCPHIKGFKFYWYDPGSWDMEEDYKHYYNLRWDEKVMYNLSDEFFHDFKHKFGGDRYVIGFGYVDHQSSGLVYDINYIEKYLFDNNLKVIITNDNR